MACRANLFSPGAAQRDGSACSADRRPCGGGGVGHEARLRRQWLFLMLELVGRPVSLDHLESALPPRHPDGYSMAELAAAARLLGLQLEGVRFATGDKPLDRPAIGFLKDAKGGHFAVFRPVGSTGTMVQVIDPPYVPWIADYDRVFSAKPWTGRILVRRDAWLVRNMIPSPLAVAGSMLIVAGIIRRRRPVDVQKSPIDGGLRPGLWKERASKHRQVELLLAGDLAELVLGAGLDLADALLGDAQLAAELFEGLLAGAADAEAADDDPPLAVVEPAEHALDGLLHALAGRFRTRVRRCGCRRRPRTSPRGR